MARNISPNVVILTRQELDERENEAFQRGVRRGRFEASSDAREARVARNCANWKEGYCETCGAQTQMMEVHGDFACPRFEKRTNWSQ